MVMTPRDGYNTRLRRRMLGLLPGRAGRVGHCLKRRDRQISLSVVSGLGPSIKPRTVKRVKGWTGRDRSYLGLRGQILSMSGCGDWG